MSIITKIPGAAFTKIAGFGDIPYRSQCVALHVFGGTLAQSLVNRVNAAMPATAIASPVIGPNYAEIDPTNGFMTGVAVPAFNSTVCMLCTDSFDANTTTASQGLGVNGPGLGNVNFYTRNAVTGFFRIISTTQYLFRSSGGDAQTSSSATGNSNGVVGSEPARYRFRSCSEDGTNARIVHQSGNMLTQSPLTAQTVTAKVSSTLSLGGSNPGMTNAKYRVAMLAVFTPALTLAQEGMVYAYMAREAAYYGLSTSN